jgi:hypothetical protein
LWGQRPQTLLQVREQLLLHHVRELHYELADGKLHEGLAL